MNAVPPDAPPASDYPVVCETPWPLWRWAFWIALVFVLHIGLFLGLGNHKPIAPRPVKNAVTFQPVQGRSEAFELQDPTVFAGPHPRGFAASTWLRPPNIPFPIFRWTDPLRLLALATEQLGTLSLSQGQANGPIARAVEVSPMPGVTILPPLPPPPAPVQSSLRLVGNLADRKLESIPAALPLQPAADNLTNTLVQVTVDEAGRVFSPALLPPGSGSREADQLALKTVAGMKFAPLGKTPRLTVATLIFEWQMEAPTNSVRAATE